MYEFEDWLPKSFEHWAFPEDMQDSSPVKATAPTVIRLVRES